MINRFKKALSVGAGAAVALSAALAVSLAGNASAIACYQYDPSGNFQTSQTPVFNNICGITSTLSSTQGSYPLGDEPNFVRIRPNTSGSPLGANNPPLVNSLSASCNNGDKFDVWTYIHNDAMSAFNNNGSGSAVAHDVSLATTAPVNTTNSSFIFGSTVSASNAASVSDTASLDCNGKQVQLTLVPGSVHFNNDLSQTSFGNLSDSVVNGSTPVGSPGPMSTGTQWGCWEFRIVVVYTVTVQQQATPTPTPTPTPTTPQTPTTLVNTGPGSIAGWVAGATMLGGLAYRWRLVSRRLSRGHR